MMLKSRTESYDYNQKGELPSLRELIAKTYHEVDDGSKGVMDLYTHCFLTGLCAQELVRRFPVDMREKLFPKGFELVSAAHDIGKANPVFQEKIRRSGIPGYKNNTGKGLRNADPELDRANGYHQAVSRAALFNTDTYIAEIVGRHHGVSPSGLAKTISAHAERYGGTAWQQLRENLLRELKSELGSQWPTIQQDSQAAVLSGLTSVADWIASGISGIDAYEESREALCRIVEEKVNHAGFIFPRIKKKLSFSEVFDGYRPYEVQQAFFNLIEGPGVYSIEEQMGRGKTEAALYAAYRLMEQGFARGIYFALPTRLTSNRIYTRFYSFLEKILDRNDTGTYPLLLHGESWLKWAEMAEQGRPGNEWFAHKRRAILAPFAVGTIDQALMAVMNVRHGFVRSFGLAGKIVILDEVHSYDSYTGRLLDVLVHELKDMGCTVIILSATLTANRRKEIMGLDTRLPIEDAYPLVTASLNNRESTSVTAEVKEHREVKVCFTSDADMALEEVLERAERGEQILWIENTVAEAQERYRSLGARTAEMSISVGLLHSRFTGKDRENIENKWVELYGKGGEAERYTRGRIFIGTQVLEQSLDIDADCLVSRIAPTDMMLQRIGRLWRHPRFDSLRPEGAQRKCMILSPSLDDVYKQPSHIFGASGYVYAPYVLARTVEAWGKREKILLPDDFRILLEETYVERDETEFAFVKRELRRETEKLRGLAAVGLSTGGTTLPENKASTRYSEEETVDVLLLKKIEENAQSIYVTLPDNSTLNLKNDRERFISLQEKKDVALKLHPHLVSVGEYMAPRAVRREELQWLSPYMYIGDNEYHPIRIALLGNGGGLMWKGDEDLSDSYSLHYSSELGYQAQKKEA